MTLLLLLAACVGSKPTPGDDTSPPAPVDADADGWGAGEDCDDADATVHPEAPETCDGRDEDCDGAVDDGVTIPSWWPDVDGDGWGAEVDDVAACEAPSGYVEPTGDCDDADPSRHPAAEETMGDGVDSDCDADFTCEELVLLGGPGEFEGAEADAAAKEFCANYNGMTGGLFVHGTSWSDLTALSCVCWVEGPVDIDDNRLLRSLDGVFHLRRADGIWVGASPQLESVAGLAGVTSPGALLFSELPQVTDLSMLRPTERVDTLWVLDVPTTTLPDLSAVTDFTHLIIEGSPDVASLEGLPATSPGVVVFKVLETAITSLDGVPPMDGVELLAIGNNQDTKLESVEGLRGLTQVGDLSLTGGTVSGFAGLEDLEAVAEDASLSTYTSDFEGLGALRTVGNDLYVRTHRDDIPTSLAGLDSLEVVGGDLTAWGVGLTDLSGMDRLTEVGGCLRLSEVSTTHGLERITSVGALEVEDTEAPDLDGLVGLVSVGAVVIDGNLALTDLTGLYGLAGIDGDLWIRSNALLTDDDGWALVAAIGEENILGTITIEENGG